MHKVPPSPPNRIAWGSGRLGPCRTPKKQDEPSYPEPDQVIPMPLLKLWNKLCGRSTPRAADQVTTDPVAAEPKLPTPKRPTPKPPKRSILGIGRGPHAGLCKQIRSLRVQTVLEVAVGDGSRALAVLNALASKNELIRYAAIDQFELADGPVSLKAFHQSLRSENVRAQIYPETIERGLLRVATTIGAVDLVLIAADQEEWKSPAVLSLLSRVTHSGSTVLFLDGEEWIRHEVAAAMLRRAA